MNFYTLVLNTKQNQLDNDLNPTIHFLDWTITGMAKSLGNSYSLAFGTFVYVHFGFTTQKPAVDGNDFATIAIVSNMEQISNIAAISLNGVVGVFKIVGMNLQSNATIPQNEDFVFDLMIRRIN